MPMEIDEHTLDTARKRYALERDRRIRPDGARQYRPVRAASSSSTKDPHTDRQHRAAVTDHVEVLVIGAGFGGLQAGAFLRDAGVESLRLMDEAGDVGGTWYWNRYPGVRCDIESYVYMPLLEEVGTMPTERYARGEEIRLHAVALAKRYGLYRDALFHTRATSLTWDDGPADWVVTTDRGDCFRARHVITSSGTLSEPKLPGIEGIEEFSGATFHTSRWDYAYTGGDQTGGLTGLAGKRVAVVGTGATGLQVVPALARDAAGVVVFQRTPSTVDVRDNRPTDPAWAASLQPGWQRERMDDFLEVLAGERLGGGLVDDSWTATARLQRQILSGAVDDVLSPAVRERQDELEDLATMQRIRARVDAVVHDPAKAEILKPWYRYMCKRPGFSDEYLQAFNQDEVLVVDTADSGGITRITERGVVVGDTEYEVDCIVFATGFSAGVSGVLSGALPVVGRDGRSLLEAWSHGPRTLHGITSHGFPNLFQLGALQNANSVNFVHVLQEQARHIAAMIQRARSTGSERVEPSVQAEEASVRTVHATARDTAAFQSACTPGYYNAEGTAAITGMTYSPGPVAFHRILQRWREGAMEDVLVPAQVPA